MCDRGCGKVLKGSKLGEVFLKPARSSFVEQLENSSHLKIALIPTRQIAATITHLERRIQQN